MIGTRIRLLALDLDGTLVGRDLTISPRVRESIALARARGAEVTIVTGRMFAATKPFAQILGIPGPLVCYQGAAIFEAASGTVLRETPVDQDVTRTVLAWAEERGVHAQCYADDRLYLQQINRFSQELHRSGARRTGARAVAERGVRRPPRRSRSCWSTIRDRRKNIWRRCKRCSARKRILTRSHVDFVEVLSPAVNKGEALAFVAAALRRDAGRNDGHRRRMERSAAHRRRRHRRRDGFRAARIARARRRGRRRRRARRRRRSDRAFRARVNARARCVAAKPSLVLRVRALWLIAALVLVVAGALALALANAPQLRVRAVDANVPAGGPVTQSAVIAAARDRTRCEPVAARHRRDPRGASKRFRTLRPPRCIARSFHSRRCR